MGTPSQRYGARTPISKEQVALVHSRDDSCNLFCNVFGPKPMRRLCLLLYVRGGCWWPLCAHCTGPTSSFGANHGQMECEHGSGGLASSGGKSSAMGGHDRPAD